MTTFLIAGPPPRRPMTRFDARRSNSRPPARFGLVIPLLLTACSAPPAGFESAVPQERVDAIAGAVRDNDTSPVTLRRLVEQLDSADPTVRLMAITALSRLTGQRHGYAYDDPLDQRRAATRRWIDAVESAGATHGAAPAAPVTMPEREKSEDLSLRVNGSSADSADDGEASRTGSDGAARS